MSSVNDAAPSNVSAAKVGKKPRRGKRGGQNVAKNLAGVAVASSTLRSGSDANSAAGDAADGPMYTIDRVGAVAAQDDVEVDPTSVPTTSGQAKPSKKRRGTRGGAARARASVSDESAPKRQKKMKADTDHDDEAYAPMFVADDIESTAGVANQESNSDRPKERTNDYDHLVASNAYYKDSDRLLPHRDPNLPNQPELGFVDPDVQVYFLSIEKMMNEQDFPTEEDRLLFVENVYKEVGSNHIKLAADSECSRVLEKLIRLSSDFQIRRLMKGSMGLFNELFRHRFSSHVMQTLLSVVADVVEREQVQGISEDTSGENAEEDDAPLPSMEELFISMCHELSDEWIGLVSDPWGSHLVRSILNVVSGESLAQPTSAIMRSKKSALYSKNNNLITSGGTAGGAAAAAEITPKRTLERKLGKFGGSSLRRKIPPSFKALLQEISSRIMSSLKEYELRTFCCHAVANPVLQFLVAIDGCGQELIKAIMSIDADNGYKFMDDLILDTVGSHLVEKILAKASPVEFHAMYVRHFKGKLSTLCNHHVANFVVQHLLANTRNGTQVRILLEEILGEDRSGIEKLFFRNRAGVIIKILEASAKHVAHQKEVFESFLSAFHVKTDEHKKRIIQLVLCQQTVEDFDAAGEKPLVKRFDYHGVSMAEHLLDFAEDYSKMLLASFMAIPSSEVLTWLTTALGSRIYEKILQSECAPQGAKKKLIYSLHTHFTHLAIDKYGSHVVDACWRAADIEAKERIAEELAKSKSMLEASFTGRFVFKNCRVDRYITDSAKSRRRDASAPASTWAAKVRGAERTRQDFLKEFGGDDNGHSEDDINATNDEFADSIDDSTASAKKKDDDNAENSLWTSTVYDETMATLGYVPGTNKTKKKKSDSRPFESGDDNDANEKNGGILSPKKSKKRGASDHEDAQVGEHGRRQKKVAKNDANKAEAMPLPSETQAAAKVDSGDVEEVLVALAATSAKKKGKKSKK
ncbi:Nucleolar protein 9 [Entophlyctis luteolus]|nr:Nucleolar protein 9 [Entophlyctis luteolus]